MSVHKIDAYTRHLANALQEIEMIYGLYTKSQYGSVTNEPVEEFMESIRDYINSLDKNKILDNNIKAGTKMALVSYLNDRLRFSGVIKLDYSSYPSIDVVCSCLKGYLTKASVSSSNSNSCLNAIVGILKHMDELSDEYRKGSLGYRYLRLFITFILYNNYSDASVVSDLILNQIIMSRRFENAKGT